MACDENVEGVQVAVADDLRCRLARVIDEPPGRASQIVAVAARRRLRHGVQQAWQCDRYTAEWGELIADGPRVDGVQGRHRRCEDLGKLACLAQASRQGRDAVQAGQQRRSPGPVHDHEGPPQLVVRPA